MTRPTFLSVPTALARDVCSRSNLLDFGLGSLREAVETTMAAWRGSKVRTALLWTAQQSWF